MASENAVNKPNILMGGYTIATENNDGVHTLKTTAGGGGGDEPSEVVATNFPLPADYPTFGGSFTANGATITKQINPPGDRKIVIDKIIWSYSRPTDPDAPINGKLSVSFDEATYDLCDITQHGPGFLPMKLKTNGIVQIDMTEGATGSTARVSVFCHYED